MLSIANEVDPLNFSAVHILYAIQTLFFQQLVSERSSISNLYDMLCEFWNQDNSFMMLEDFAINFLLRD